MEPAGQAIQDAAASTSEPQRQDHPDIASLHTEPHQLIPVDEGINAANEDVQHARPPALTAQPDAMGENSNSTGRRSLFPFVCDSHISIKTCNSKSLWPHKCARDDRKPVDRKPVYRKRVYHCLGENHGEKCTAILKSYTALNRHYSSVHISKTNKAKLDCSSKGCSRVGDNGFTRKDNLRQHMRDVHGENIPKNPVRFNGWDRNNEKPLIKNGTSDGDMMDRDHGLGGL